MVHRQTECAIILRAMTTKLLWVDVESSGLDPHNDCILEIAGFLTTLDHALELPTSPTNNPIDALRGRSGGFSEVVRYDQRQLLPFIEDMHTKNGLLLEASACHTFIGDVDRYLFQHLSSEKEKVILAGSSVHFDLGFIRAHMPHSAGFLSHRVYDVTAIKLFCQSLGMPPFKKAEAHRAAADVLESVAHARMCRDWLARWGIGEHLASDE